jgi:hypothetical protein
MFNADANLLLILRLDGRSLNDAQFSLKRNLSSTRWMVAGMGCLGLGKCDQGGRFLDKKNIMFQDCL